MSVVCFHAIWETVAILRSSYVFIFSRVREILCKLYLLFVCAHYCVRSSNLVTEMKYTVYWAVQYLGTEK